VSSRSLHQPLPSPGILQIYNTAPFFSEKKYFFTGHSTGSPDYNSLVAAPPGEAPSSKFSLFIFYLLHLAVALGSHINS